MPVFSRALISCTNKSGLIELARFLTDKKIQILSTGGTAKLFKENNIAVTEVSQETGFPEILDGRVKTLHPRIFGGILAKRHDLKHQKQLAENSIGNIDLVVVNLYDFDTAANKPELDLDEVLESIDIGGPSLLRAAAKNFNDVLVVVDPEDYPELTQRIVSNTVGREFRLKLAAKVFEVTARYDQGISNYLQKTLPKKTETTLPDNVIIHLKKIQELRYGENPQQKAALYQQNKTQGLTAINQIQGKQLSFNNILDMNAALNCCREFKNPTCVIVKHINPCGIASTENLSTAFIRAREADPVSSFGGIVALNQKVDKQTALIMAETFFEVIVAPDYDDDALLIFQKKKNLRIIKYPQFDVPTQKFDLRCIDGGFLVQDVDHTTMDVSQARVVTNKKPDDKQISDLNFAWRVCKHVKSNAIVFAKNRQTLGIGAGQMSRVDAVKLAVLKDKESFNVKNVLEGAVMASDAFFPFRDGLDLAAGQGITAVVQPGGSVRDNEVIQACNENGIAMVFTGMRHFKH